MVSDSQKNGCKMAFESFFLNSKKYQEHEIVHNLWQIPMPQRYILSIFWGHLSIVNFDTEVKKHK